MLKMKSLSENRNVFYGLMFSCISLIVALIGSFIVTPVVLNRIGDKNYGLLAFCNSITIWLNLVSEALGASYIYFVTKEAKETGDEKQTNSLFFKMLSVSSVIAATLSFVVVAILKFSGFQFSKYTPSENDLIFVLLVISGLNVSVTIFFSTFRLFNSYKKQFVFVRLVMIIISILTYFANYIIAITVKSIITIAVFSVGFSFLHGLINCIYALKIKRMHFDHIRICAYKDEFHSIVKYSSVIMVGTIIGNIDSNLDKTLLGLMVNAESVTMYNLSIIFFTYLNVLAWAFIETMRPKIHELYASNRIDEANSLFLKICKMQSIVVLLIIGGFISCGYHFITLWIGSQRIAVYYYTVALFLARIVPLTKQASGEAYRANNIHRITVRFSFISIAMNLALSILLIFILKNEYAVWACIIGTVVPMFLFSYIVVPILDVKKLKLPIKKYYLELFKLFLIMAIAIVPALIETIIFEKTELILIIRVLIEGCTFVLFYVIGIVLFEKETIKNVYYSYIKRDKILR